MHQILKTPGDPDAAIVSIRPKTGQIVWHYQFTPNEAYDYDACWELILADKTIDGKKRKVVMQMNRNGFLYVLDRASFDKLTRQDPAIAIKLLTNLGRELASHLRRANRTIYQLAS